MTNYSREEMDELIAQFLSGNATTAEQQQLEDWIEASAANRLHFLGLREAWLATARTGSYDALSAWQEMRTQLSPKPVWYAGWKKAIRIAASFILPFIIGGSAVLAWVYKGKTANPDGMVTITSPKGATTRIELSDGTEVWLNAGSKLQYAHSYNGLRREVKLEGEAFFKVHTNPQKPFTVKAADLRILALGTSFNVKAYPEDKTVVTTLIDGEVKIDGSATSKPFNMMMRPHDHVVYQKPVTNNEKQPAPAPDNGHSTTPVATKAVDNTEIYTAWKDGNWIVEAQTFAELAVTMERKFNVQVIFQDEALKAYKFTGTFRQETLEQVLNILKLTAPLKYTIDKGTVTVSVDQLLKEKYSNALKSGR
ncbi:FecR family protein [Chitinophaga jiangningensis]|uniref:FecR family protein n=1 Tax=Chitinophaga jiangningensis TaxID=1419482 RepID=A0A1M7I0F3_9BACT|nr:FecR domain-containing protein [Chitinophaga jiangningensis]SHM34252.1 FecR family protein [Chitinophaga jiangningensis]